MATHHCGEGRECPIITAPCPGECVVADTLRFLESGIVVLDHKNKGVVFINEQARMIFGRAELVVVYDIIYEVLFADGWTVNHSSDAADTSQTVQLGSRLVGYSVHNVVENFSWIFLKDITEKIRLVSIAETAAQMTNIGYIFSGIRHEIGNPLNSIKMTLSVLQEDADHVDAATVQAYITRCLDAVSKVEYLLRNLKNFNMYERLEVQPVCLPNFLHELQSLSEIDVARRGIRLEIVTQDDLSCVCADPRALQQVMLNLITNACDALADTKEPKIVVSATSRDGLVWIRVIDNGIGIGGDTKLNLFKPFYTSKTQGTGLGLVICQKLMTKMGGDIELTANEDVGCMVTLTLPEGTHDC